ncbi:MAG: hypothetical protein QNI90_03575 [Dinoroseobacter sp.]|nr:hypothetical protein [Dinoroseobacter sp.]
MVFGFRGMSSLGGLIERHIFRLRAFLSAQGGGISVDFVPIVAAVIGLALGVVSVTSSALESSSEKIAATVGSFDIQTRLPGFGAVTDPDSSDAPQGVQPQPANTPQVERAPASGGSTGGTIGQANGLETRTSGVTVSVDRLGSAAGVSTTTETKDRDEAVFTDQWLFPD